MSSAVFGIIVAVVVIAVVVYFLVRKKKGGVPKGPEAPLPPPSVPPTV